MKKINFKCPECGDSTLAVCHLVHETLEVESIDSEFGTPWFVYGEVLSTDTVDVMDYSCDRCGYHIGYSDATVMTWLEEHGMLEDDSTSHP